MQVVASRAAERHLSCNMCPPPPRRPATRDDAGATGSARGQPSCFTRDAPSTWVSHTSWLTAHQPWIALRENSGMKRRSGVSYASAYRRPFSEFDQYALNNLITFIFCFKKSFQNIVSSRRKRVEFLSCYSFMANSCQTLYKFQLAAPARPSS